jgi:hypothetical protein
MMHPIALLAAVTLNFLTSGAFFTTETNQGTPLDPFVFVKESRPAQNAKSEAGPLNIVHEAGLRPAMLSDDGATPLYNADGTQLGVSLVQWLGAHGVAQLMPAGSDAETVTATFYGLIPDADYSLFEGRIEHDRAIFTPLDGSGNTNSFRSGADGRASITVTVPHMLTRADAIELVYHSDNQSHGTSPGNPGYTAHPQLVARLP